MKNNKNLIEELLIFDAHCDTANVLYHQSSYFIKETKSHLNIEKAKKGGLKAQIFALYVNPVYAPHRSIKKALLLYNALEKRLFSSRNALKVTSTIEMEETLKDYKITPIYQ